MATGDPYDVRYATSVTFRGGRIATYREYWNPQVFLAALGGQAFRWVSVDWEGLPTRLVDGSSGSTGSPGRLSGGVPASSGPGRLPARASADGIQPIGLQGGRLPAT